MATLLIEETGIGGGANRVFQDSLLRVHHRPLVGEAFSSPVGRLEVEDQVEELATLVGSMVI